MQTVKQATSKDSKLVTRRMFKNTSNNHFQLILTSMTCVTCRNLPGILDPHMHELGPTHCSHGNHHEMHLSGTVTKNALLSEARAQSREQERKIIEATLTWQHEDLASQISFRHSASPNLNLGTCDTQNCEAHPLAQPNLRNKELRDPIMA